MLASGTAWAQNLSLEHALETARLNRQSIRSAELGLESARFRAKALGSYPPTSIGVGLSSRSELGATDQDLYLSQPLDVFGRTAAHRRLGQATVAIAEAELQAAHLKTQSEVLTAYFEAATAERLSKVAAEIAKLAQSLHQVAVRRFEEGKVPEVQVIRAVIELERSKQTSLLRAAQATAAMKRLWGAIGKEEPLPVDEDVVMPLSLSMDTANRPDLRSLEAQIQEVEAAGRVASKEWLPTLELQGLRSPWREEPAAFGGRLQLTWSLLDHGRNGSDRSAAKATSESLQEAYKDARARANTELKAVTIEIEAALAQVKTYETIRESARLLVDRSQRGYVEGFSTLIDVLEATRSLREVEQELAEARLSANRAEVTRHEVTGTLIGVQK